MLEKLARIPKRIVMSEASGREGVRLGQLAVLGSNNEEADVGVGRGRGAGGSRYCRRGETGGVVVRRRRCAGAPAKRPRDPG